MQDNINNKPDAFSEIFRQKLENHKLPVDADSWSEIEARLNAKKKKRVIPFWFWFSGGAAVATLALLFTLRTFTDSPTNFAKLEQKEIKTEQNKTKQIAVQQVYKIDKEIGLNQSDTKQHKNSKKTNLLIENDFATIQAGNKDTIESENVLTLTSKNRIQDNESIAQIEYKDEDSALSKTSKEVFPTDLNKSNDNNQVIQNKHKNSWLLAASFGSGGNISLTGANNANAMLLYNAGDKALSDATTTYNSILAPNDFSNITHYAPVSFGLVVRKNLDRVWSLESGLVYTYLLSTFENQDMQRSDAKLHLHYIGVPLNLVARVWKSPKWEVYLSSGGMMEKGIRSIYIQNQYFGNQILTTTAATKISGLQWSVNGAVGTTYKLHRNLGIYFEPRISYYFDNNQPESARTDQPVVIGLNVGLRFQF